MEDFRAQAHRLADWIADYLEHPERYPGARRRCGPERSASGLPPNAPEHGETFDAIFADFERVIVPGLTHWNHPGFFAYFAITASGPGILAEFLSAALNQQAMLWRTSPAATELEAVRSAGCARSSACRRPSTASSTTPRRSRRCTRWPRRAKRRCRGVRAQGLAGRSDVSGVRVYC